MITRINLDTFSQQNGILQIVIKEAEGKRLIKFISFLDFKRVIVEHYSALQDYSVSIEGTEAEVKKAYREITSNFVQAIAPVPDTSEPEFHGKEINQ
jgi:hypothetical protein